MIAVVGAGISGLTASWLLARRHDVLLLEQSSRLGGHTHTHVFETPDGRVALDTGFIVYNDRTYPRLVRLFDEIGVERCDSDMSFAVSCRRTGFEYSTRDTNAFFADRRNLVRSAHYRLFFEILRFNRESRGLLHRQDAERVTLGEFLDQHRFQGDIVDRYVLPLASAIWSASPDAIRQFPALTLVRFFDQHGMLMVRGAPIWKIVRGGSASYIGRMTGSPRLTVHTGVALRAVRRTETGVSLQFTDRADIAADHVVFACSGEEALRLLEDATASERAVLSAFRTSLNDVWLHTDASFLPRRPVARASWNYLLGDGPDRRDADLSSESSAAALDPRGLLRDAQPVTADCAISRPGAHDLPASALYRRGDGGADPLGRGQRRQSRALLRRVLVLRLPRRRRAIGGARRRRARSRVVAAPALYTGRLRHRRFRPRPHEFSYNLFMVLVDVDRVAEQMAVSRLTSVNRFNWAAFDDRDHLGEAGRPLRERLAIDAAKSGLALPDGPIHLLTHLRYLGYAFNPISFYYCYTAAGELELVAGEVSNTFGDQRTYWLDRRGAPGRPFQARAVKTMHVSPFMGMDVDYEFILTPPGPSLVAHMNTFARDDSAGTPFFDATLTLERRPWRAAEIHRALARHPWMTAKVIGAIHWEALRLWLKGVPVHPHPDESADRKRSKQEANA